MAKLTELRRDITRCEAVSRGADFPNAMSGKAAGQLRSVLHTLPRTETFAT